MSRRILAVALLALAWALGSLATLAPTPAVAQTPSSRA